MKLTRDFMLLIVAALHVKGSVGKPQHHLRRQTVAVSTNGRLQAYGQIMSGDSHADACIELPTAAYNQVEKNLVLGDCKSSSSSGWRFGHNGQIHSEWNDEYCIQTAAHEGAHLKLLPCDAKNDNPLQIFVYHNHGRAIRPKSNNKLCVTYEGNHADIGTDKLVLKECNKIEFQRHWIGPFPRSTDDNGQQETLEEGSV